VRLLDGLATILDLCRTDAVALGTYHIILGAEQAQIVRIGIRAVAVQHPPPRYFCAFSSGLWPKPASSTRSLGLRGRLRLLSDFHFHGRHRDSWPWKQVVSQIHSAGLEHGCFALVADIWHSVGRKFVIEGQRPVAPRQHLCPKRSRRDLATIRRPAFGFLGLEHSAAVRWKEHVTHIASRYTGADLGRGIWATRGATAPQVPAPASAHQQPADHCQFRGPQASGFAKKYHGSARSRQGL